MLSTCYVTQKLDYTVPDWNQVRRKGLAVRRDLRDALSNLVRFLSSCHSRCPFLYSKQHLLQSKSALNGNVDMSPHVAENSRLGQQTSSPEGQQGLQDKRPADRKDLHLQIPRSPPNIPNQTVGSTVQVRQILAGKSEHGSYCIKHGLCTSCQSQSSLDKHRVRRR